MGAGHNNSSNKMHSRIWIFILVVGRIPRIASAVVGNCVSDESEKRYVGNSITSLTDDGKLQVANPSAPDLTITTSCVEGE